MTSFTQLNALRVNSSAQLNANRSAKTNLRAKGGRKTVVTTAILDEFVNGVKEAWRFDNWAPRSARAWGKGDYLQLSKDAPVDRTDSDSGMLSEATLRAIRDEAEMGDDRQKDLAQAFMERSNEIEVAESESSIRDPGFDLRARAEELNAEGYFDEYSEDFVLNGETLAILCFNKYGFFHDMAIKQDCLNKGGMQRWVALNLYFGYVGLRGFPYSDAEYVEKMEAVAAIIAVLKQEKWVYDFFKERVYPRRGLPSRPRQDTAVTLRLNKSPTWDKDLAEEWFSENTYQ